MTLTHSIFLLVFFLCLLYYLRFKFSNFFNYKRTAYLKIIFIILPVSLFYLLYPTYKTPFKEAILFKQYKPCNKIEEIQKKHPDYPEILQIGLSNFNKKYDLVDILIAEFQTSFIIFGFNQTYYFNEGLDCLFEKRYSFKETIENGKYLTFFLRRIFGISSLIIFFFLIKTLYSQFKIVFSKSSTDAIKNNMINEQAQINESEIKNYKYYLKSIFNYIYIRKKIIVFSVLVICFMKVMIHYFLYPIVYEKIVDKILYEDALKREINNLKTYEEITEITKESFTMHIEVIFSDRLDLFLPSIILFLLIIWFFNDKIKFNS